MADDKEQQSLINRIQKLLALGESSNPNEAAAALSRAQKLMELHGISQKEISMNGISEEQCTVGAGLRSQSVCFALGHIISDSFGLDFFVHNSSASTVSTMTFVGPKDRLESAVYTCVFLQRQLKIASTERRKKQRAVFEKEILDKVKMFANIPPIRLECMMSIGKIPETMSELRKVPGLDFLEADKKIKNWLSRDLKHYMDGWLQAVQDKVVEFANDSDETKKLTAEYLGKHHPDIHIVNSQRRGLSAENYNVYCQGLEDGSNGFELLHGVTGSATQALEHHK